MRALPLIGRGAKYGRRWYLDLLVDSGNIEDYSEFLAQLKICFGEELFGPFGYTKEKILKEKHVLLPK